MGPKQLLFLLFAVSSFVLPNAKAVAQVIPPDVPITQQPAPELKKIQEEDADNIFRHRDIYFLSGEPDSKVQLSFKLRPIRSENLYFAYTQQMFWELGKNSAPFSDINYNPELFYEWGIGKQFVRYIRAGIEHRSNGEEGPTSRSVDSFNVDTQMAVGLGKYEVLWNLKLHRNYDIDWVNNRDIANYMGWWSTRFAVQGVDADLFPRKAEAYISFYPGGANGDKIGNGALEMGLKYRARLFGFMPYLMVQYYYGYMESLITYNEKTHSYRLGFQF
ncbi:MAG: hypothetical protein EOP07_04525 [Proteobacteria bacterium]|nr:MAG: hypothetical protein EOP07_04525 [Pseudomonadota bacterium]